MVAMTELHEVGNVVKIQNKHAFAIQLSIGITKIGRRLFEISLLYCNQKIINYRLMLTINNTLNIIIVIKVRRNLV